MLRPAKTLCLSLAATLALGSSVRATPLDPTIVPSTAKWVFHVDVDAARDSKLGALVVKYLPPEKRDEIVRGLEDVRDFTGTDLVKETRAVTLFGRDFDEKSAVVIIDAPIDEKQVRSLVRMSRSFKSYTKGEHEIVSWTDDNDGKLHFGSIFSATRLVIGNDRAEVEAAVETLDGGKSMADIEEFKPASGPGVIAVMYGDGLNDLVKAQQPDSPLVDLVKMASMSLTESGDTLKLDGKVTAVNAEAAEQIESVLNGGKAFVLIAARRGEHKDDPKAKAAAEGLAKAKVSTAEDVVKVEWPVEFKTIAALLEAVAAEQAAAEDKDKGL